MNRNRMTFIGNPWPEGHPIRTFDWTAELRGNVVWFHFHLETEDYDAEREADDLDEDAGSWESPSVWHNYNSCKLSSTYWHDGGFPVCSVEQFSAEYLDGLEVRVDEPPIGDLEDLAFHVYLLGHDSVADHTIRFDRVPGTNRFDIRWHGKAALTYAGDDEFKYSFRAEISDVELPKPSVRA
jgi:hypothetical protein